MASIKVQPGKLVEGRARAQKMADRTGRPVSLLQPFYRQGKYKTKRVWTTYDTVYPSRRNPLSLSLPRNKWVNAKVQVTSSGKVLAKVDENVLGRLGKVFNRRRNPGTKLPGLQSWSMYAGGTSAAPGKHGYDYRTSKQTYSIDPYSSQYGRHLGYRLSVYPGDPARGHQQLGTYRSPQAAVSAAKKWAMEHD